MIIAKVTQRGWLGKGRNIQITGITHGKIGVSTNKGMSVTLKSTENDYITITAAEFRLIERWFKSNGCEEEEIKKDIALCP